MPKPPNKLINPPLGDVFYSYHVIFPATFVTLFTRQSHMRELKLKNKNNLHPVTQLKETKNLWFGINSVFFFFSQIGFSNIFSFCRPGQCHVQCQFSFGTLNGRPLPLPPPPLPPPPPPPPNCPFHLHIYERTNRISAGEIPGPNRVLAIDASLLF